MRWTSLGTPGALFEIAQADEADRRFVPCGWVTMRASGLRVVKNVLDLAHFPFVHIDTLGSEPQTEVPRHDREIRCDVDKVCAANCTFFQSRIAATETTGDFVHLTCRVPAPFVAMLYRICPGAPHRLDATALFIRPMEADLCRAQPVTWRVDGVATHTALLQFEQVIFAQDRPIVEHQRPLLLPLEPRAETPTRADLSSVACWRWLKEKGLRFGTTAGVECRSTSLRRRTRRLRCWPNRRCGRWQGQRPFSWIGCRARRGLPGWSMWRGCSPLM